MQNCTVVPRRLNAYPDSRMIDRGEYLKMEYGRKIAEDARMLATMKTPDWSQTAPIVIGRINATPCTVTTNSSSSALKMYPYSVYACACHSTHYHHLVSTTATTKTGSFSGCNSRHRSLSSSCPITAQRSHQPQQNPVYLLPVGKAPGATQSHTAIVCGDRFSGLSADSVPMSANPSHMALTSFLNGHNRHYHSYHQPVGFYPPVSKPLSLAQQSRHFP